MKAEGNQPWGFGLHSWICFKLGFTASFLPPCFKNSKPRKWVIPQRWIKTWAFKNAGSSENRSGEEEVGEDVCVGTGHRSCPGCAWWAFLSVQRTAMHSDSCVLPTHSLFSLGCLSWLKSSAMMWQVPTDHPLTDYPVLEAIPPFCQIWTPNPAAELQHEQTPLVDDESEKPTLPHGPQCPRTGKAPS